jgi:phosphoglycerate dehydrogenase-like enzyme
MGPGVGSAHEDGAAMTARPPRDALRVAFAGTFASRLADEVRARLTMPAEIVLGSEAGIAARMAGVDALVSLAFTREMAATATRLGLVQIPGAGLDRVDRAALPAGTWLANAYGHEVGIAEYAIGAMLALTRDFVRLDASLRRGIWESQWAPGVPPPAPWPELAGKTLGILGYGRIGRCVADRASAFGMKIHAIRRRAAGADASGLKFLGGPEHLDAVIRRADYLVVALSLDERTRGLIDARAIASMKPTAVLVNVARAEIVDGDALYRALAGRAIAGAALDVWYRYPTGDGPTPPAAQPFHELPNVLITPHVSGWTEGMLAARADVIAGNLARLARGEPPINLVVAGDAPAETPGARRLR